jgi:hypothetical protein
MKSVKVLFFILAFAAITGEYSSAQTILDKQRIINFKNFFNYLRKTDTLNIDTSLLQKKYINISYIKNDTSRTRLLRRTSYFISLCYILKKVADTLKIHDYGAMNIKSYHLHDPKEYEELQTNNDNIYVYFLKSHPDAPLGFLLFAPNSDKIYSCILINQGGYHYFLTLNLL